jgi:hypothetical protein
MIRNHTLEAPAFPGCPFLGEQLTCVTSGSACPPLPRLPRHQKPRGMLVGTGERLSLHGSIQTVGDRDPGVFSATDPIPSLQKRAKGLLLGERKRGQGRQQEPGRAHARPGP